jgi:catechol 2,3-dioxygenase-like lactoylglutathione lyase family enzyme
MKPGYLEHVNVTVSDPDATAALLARLFGWRVRWAGLSQSGGRSVHVGTDAAYVAVYGPVQVEERPMAPGRFMGGLNHIAVVVDDLAEVEERVKAAGLTPFNHGSYEPGRRFYFYDGDGVEFEVVSYAAA